MSREQDELRRLIRGMRDCYARGGNAMAYARAHFASDALDAGNSIAATLVAYDLQAGAYTAAARSRPDERARWCGQVADTVRPWLPPRAVVLEVGCGEATTLAGMLHALGDAVERAAGFDLSWSRVDEGRRWLREQGTSAELFVGDLFGMPLADDSVDVVFSSHSLEPNGGREKAAILECLRVAREAVVLIEPRHDLAGAEARARMEQHGYVRDLRDAAVAVGAEVLDDRLLDFSLNPLNPSGVLVLRKQRAPLLEAVRASQLRWRCPLTGAPMESAGDVFYAPEVGIAYPVMGGIPLLRPEHAVVASGIGAARAPRAAAGSADPGQ